jgi:hypothetical protein
MYCKAWISTTSPTGTEWDDEHPGLWNPCGNKVHYGGVCWSHKHMAIAPKAKKRPRFTQTERMQLAARQNWKCDYCDSLLPSSFQIDHIIPLHLNGPHSMDNAHALCGTCHADKTQVEAQGKNYTHTAPESGNIIIIIPKHCFMLLIVVVLLMYV